MEKGEIRALPSPITFPCYVEGKPLEATMTHLENNYIQYILHFSFSDGYQAEFIHTNEALCESEEELAYLRAIKYDIRALGKHSFETKAISFPFPHEGHVHNLWIFQDEIEEKQYGVFYKGEYRFRVIETPAGFELDLEPNLPFTSLDEQLSKKAIILIKAYSN